MKPEAQRIAIAEACGFKRAKDFEGWEDPRVWTSNGKNRFFAEQLPDYLSDLNAMHEAEKACFDQRGAAIHGEYIEHLRSTVTAGHQPEWMCRCNADMCIYATAAQRAEAFLRTLGKWEDGQ